VDRGDQAFSQGKYDAALAEYRLAVRQGSTDGPTLARLAHTYAMVGEVDDAGEYYARAVEADESMRAQAVTDLMHVAGVAMEAGDRFAMASAVELALGMEPGLGVGRLALPLARHYFTAGEFGRALPFYQKALVGSADSLPDVVFEVGQAYEEVGDCRHALPQFERYRGLVRAGRRREADWHIGTCSFELAQAVAERAGAAPGDLEDALAMVDRTLALGEPQNIQAQVWFLKGEILSDLGRCEDAMEAFAQVRYADQAGALVSRAQQRFDEIRFGQGLEGFREGRCR